MLLYRDLYSREMLDDYLSRALSIELENKRLALIDKSEYVLTLDYTIKMLNIHERFSLSLSLFTLPLFSFLSCWVGITPSVPTDYTQAHISVMVTMYLRDVSNDIIIE